MIPTRWSSLIFHVKANVLRMGRGLRNLREGVPRRHLPRHWAQRRDEEPMAVLAESRAPLWTDEGSDEQAYQLGKVQNLRVAARGLDGIRIPAGQIFSFWRQVGRPTKRAGFVTGRMLRQGCFLPSIGGGLCQLSNALYQVALAAGSEVIERHPHSRIVPGSESELGRDATVAWNYVDLRFRASRELHLEVKLTGGELIVRLRGVEVAPRTLGVLATKELRQSANDCLTCGEDACLHHPRAAALRVSGRTRTAYLADENWPEFQRFVAEQGSSSDALFVPVNGARWGIGRYRWPVEKFGDVREARWATVERSLRTRRLAGQGAARQAALLAGAEQLARVYGRGLAPQMTRFVVAQSLLPFLWRAGELGGRTFSVLMTRLPMAELERRLDAAWRRHPERVTLGDFRAPAELVAAEAEALEEAEEIISPHAEVAELFGNRARRLPWAVPAEVVPAERGEDFVLGFAGPIAARRGAFEVRAAARELQVPVIWSGANFEGADFWRGVDARRVGPKESGWIRRVSVLVAPVIVESRPQAALMAMAAGVPVIATVGSGLAAGCGVRLIREPGELTEVLRDWAAAGSRISRGVTRG